MACFCKDINIVCKIHCLLVYLFVYKIYKQIFVESKYEFSLQSTMKSKTIFYNTT